jgi:hypothetical protein
MLHHIAHAPHHNAQHLHITTTTDTHAECRSGRDQTMHRGRREPHAPSSMAAPHTMLHTMPHHTLISPQALARRLSSFRLRLTAHSFATRGVAHYVSLFAHGVDHIAGRSK